MTCKNCSYIYPKKNEDFNFLPTSACHYLQFNLIYSYKRRYFKYLNPAIKFLYTPAQKYKLIKVIRNRLFNLAHYGKF